MKIVACGVSGLIGRPLVKKLAERYEVICLVRSAGPRNQAVRFVVWKPGKIDAWAKELEGAHAVINLSGEPIAGKRWTSAQKETLKASRILTTKTIVDAIGQAEIKPKALVNGSAIGFYGARDNSSLDEDAAPGKGFLPELCREWEREAQRAETFGVRVVNLRTGIVLSSEGGALSKMMTPFKMFIGGPLGGGRQIMSWIHIEDEVNAIIRTVEDASLRGPVNLAAPFPVSMSEFAQTLGRVLKRPSLFPVPSPILKILLGEMSEMLLTGQNVRPKKLLQSGFKFRYEKLEEALKDLLRRP